MKNADVRPDGDDFYISLSKLTGLGIADIWGYITSEFGEPVFKVSRIIFSNGLHCGVEGEHDFPYLTTYPSDVIPGIDDGDIMRELDEDEG